MTKIKIWVERETCIGCGSCVATCEQNFELGDDNIAKAKNEHPSDNLEANKEAFENCPVDAIKMQEEQ